MEAVPGAKPSQHVAEGRGGAAEVAESGLAGLLWGGACGPGTNQG